jgi:hypothetical protein
MAANKKPNKKYNPNKHRNTSTITKYVDRLNNGGDINDPRFDTLGYQDSDIFSKHIYYMIDRLYKKLPITGEISWLNGEVYSDINSLQRLYILTYCYVELVKQSNTPEVVKAALEFINYIREWVNEVLTKLLDYIDYEDAPEGYGYQVKPGFSYMPKTKTIDKLMIFMAAFNTARRGKLAYAYAEAMWNGAKNMAIALNVAENKAIAKLLDPKPFMEALEQILIEQKYLEVA